MTFDQYNGKLNEACRLAEVLLAEYARFNDPSFYGSQIRTARRLMETSKEALKMIEPYPDLPDYSEQWAAYKAHASWPVEDELP